MASSHVAFAAKDSTSAVGAHVIADVLTTTQSHSGSYSGQCVLSHREKMDECMSERMNESDSVHTIC